MFVMVISHLRSYVKSSLPSPIDPPVIRNFKIHKRIASTSWVSVKCWSSYPRNSGDRGQIVIVTKAIHFRALAFSFLSLWILR